MSNRRKFNSILAKARSDSYKLVKKELKAVLPKGWEVYFAAGWGLTVYDDKGNTIIGLYEVAPARLPGGVRKALLLAADFCDTYGYGNEVIRAKS